MMTLGKPMSSILVVCGDKSRAQRYYVPALLLAGWTGPLQFLSPEDAPPTLETVAGLLLCGGRDIHPRRWDVAEAVHPAADPDEPRDALEIPLVQAAWARRVPMLGICRGEQILNVALGGSLHQDIPSDFGREAARHQQGGPEDRPQIVPHNVVLAHGSRLASLLGVETIPVNSRHHQAVREIAPCFDATGWDPDTRDRSDSRECLIEAIEAQDPSRWVVGVQWHPENLVDRPDEAGQAARNLFKGFLAAIPMSS